LSVLLITIIYLQILLKMRTVQSSGLKDKIWTALKKLAIYPVIVIALWLYPAWFDTNIALWGSEASQQYYTTDIGNFFLFGAPFLMGFFTSVAFILTNWSMIENSYGGFISRTPRQVDLPQARAVEEIEQSSVNPLSSSSRPTDYERELSIDAFVLESSKSTALRNSSIALRHSNL